MPIHTRLLAAIPQVGIVLIAGDIRSGKSVLAYGLVEELHNQHPDRPAHVFGFPQDKISLLPTWITPINDPEFPDGSMVIADEAYREFHSRASMSDSNKFIDQFSGLAGQKDILMVYLTQTTRKLEVALVSGAQVFLLKKPSRLMTLLDRSTLRPLLARAFEAFHASAVPSQQCVYVVADAFEGFLEHSNTTPTFWSQELSKAWQGVTLTGAVNQPEDTTEGRITVAHALIQALAQKLLTGDMPEVQRAMLALEPITRGEYPSDDLGEALQGCLPHISGSAKELAKSLLP